MMGSKVEIILTLTVLLGLAQGQKKMFCYYNAESQYRPGIGRFVPSDIDANLCTHIVFSFANVSGLELTNTNWNDRIPGGLYEQTVALKQQNPDLKILLAVGGWEIGSEPFKELAETWQSRNTFSKNVVRYLRQYGFDGLDMDWEFPGTRGSPPGDKWKFTDLMRQLQNEFTQEARETGNDKLLLTLAAASGVFYINQSYQPKELIKTLDYMLLMSYNYHGNWENTTGHHTGLWPNRIDEGKKRQLNIDWSVDYWLDQGMPKDRLIMGLSSYGMSYSLNFTDQNRVGAPARGGGNPGTYTQEAGILAYYEICENLQYKNWNRQWIPEQDSPYAFSGDQWVGYDDKDSLTIKANYAKQRDLGGAMLWSVETDDFSGSCGQGRYPLLKTVNGIIRDGQTGPQGNGNQGSGNQGNGGNRGNQNGGNRWNGGNQGNGNQNGGNQWNPGNQGTGGNQNGGNRWNGGNQGNSNQWNPSNQGGGNVGGRGSQGSGRFNCASVGPGAHANPSDCRTFFLCTETEDDYIVHQMTCPKGLAFFENIKACDWAESC